MECESVVQAKENGKIQQINITKLSFIKLKHNLHYKKVESLTQLQWPLTSLNDICQLLSKKQCETK